MSAHCEKHAGWSNHKPGSIIPADDINDVPANCHDCAVAEQLAEATRRQESQDDPLGVTYAFSKPKHRVPFFERFDVKGVARECWAIALFGWRMTVTKW